MSTQITVRIPDDLAAFADLQVSEGKATSRADAVARALALHRQREEALRDLEVIKALNGTPYPDLADLVDGYVAADADLG
jgi:Arc/MetJ-type ribon-helix-helix transcriptional regulator